MPADPGRVAYFDTSVLVKCYVREDGTPRALELLGRYAVVSSTIAPVELTSALRRHRQRGGISADDLVEVDARIRAERSFWTLIAVEAAVLGRAEALTRAAGVKTLDALHLASAMVLLAETGASIPFLTADRQQRRAATALGLDVIFVEEVPV